MNLRIMLCDERPLISAGIRAILDTVPDIEVTMLVRDLRETPALVQELEPDAVLLGIQQLDSAAVSTISDITGQSGRPTRGRVLLLVENANDSYLRKAIHAGARGIVRTDLPAAEMVRAVREVAAGHAVLPPALTGALLAEVTAYRGSRTLPPPLFVRSLTSQELRVLQLIAGGMTDAEVARALGISVATVRSHVHHALTKLNLHGRVQAVAYIHRYGMASTDGRPDVDGEVDERCSTPC